MKNFLFLSLLAFALFTTGCGSDDDGLTGPAFCTNQAFSEALTNAVANLSAAAETYANDDTPANCQAYRAAAQDYLDEIRRFENCAVIGARQDFRDSLLEAQESVDMITC